MSKNKIFLAVDLGASSGRVIAGELKQGKLSLSEIHRFSNQGVRAGERIHWNWLGLWQDIKDGLRIAGKQFADAEIVSVGVDTWGVDFVLMGRDHSPVGTPICYRDDQTAGILEKAFAVVPRKTIFERTGLQFMPINSLYQLFAMQSREPERFDSVERFLMMPDFFHWLLSGVYSNEYSDATTSQLIDPRTGNWAEDLIDSFRLPRKMFGPIVQPGTHIGNLRSDLAKETGLSEIKVVVPGCHDTASAVAAVPVAEPDTTEIDWCYISSGTWSLVGVELPEPVISETVEKFNLTNEGGVENTTRLLKNVTGLWLVQECQRIWKLAGQDYDWQQLVELAERSTPLLAHVPPDHSDLMAPENMPDAIQNLCRATGQPVPQDVGAIIRCALESIALRYRMVIESLEETVGSKIRRIHIVGGGTQNKLLNRLSAEATGRTVFAGPVEATAIGNIMMQMIGAGELQNVQRGRELVAESFPVQTFEPSNDNTSWRDAYERFLELPHS